MLQGVITISDLRQKVSLGCSDEERAYPQIVNINLSLQLDIEKASSTDDINETVNYLEVVETIERLSEVKSWRLIESLARDVAEGMLERFNRVSSLDIEVRKFIVPQTSGISCKLHLAR